MSTESRPPESPALPSIRLRSEEAFEAHLRAGREAAAEHERVLQALLPETPGPFTIRGHSWCAGREVDFAVDFEFSDGKSVNWRERVLCPATDLNNRMRLSAHLLEELVAEVGERVYLTEHLTPFASYWRRRHPGAESSEFQPDAGLRPGQRNARGVRHEDLTGLSFEDGSFDVVASFDVLEHVPDYLQALRECARVLRPGGWLLLTVPFGTDLSTHRVLAELRDGEVHHFAEPEYHGDPIRGEGILCFRHFGWSLLEELRACGFSDAFARPVRSMHYGYLGPEQLVFYASR